MTRKFVVACGGTGGHVFPGLAVADELQKRGHTVEIWVAGRDIEASAVAKECDNVFATGMRPLSFINLPRITSALWRCGRRIKLVNPTALLAMGSYASLSPVVAAYRHKVPVVLHEANAIPGKAVDLLSRIAFATAYSFEGTEKYLRGRKTVLTGMPVRTDLDGCANLEDVSSERFTFLVTGGSQGARRVNQLTTRAFQLLRDSDAPKFHVIHQCGKADLEWVGEMYEKADVSATVSAFITEMGRAYATADFVIARAGASTCFELCLVGKPALLIPLPSAKDDHQNLNADVLARVGGADKAIEEELSARSLMRYLSHKMRSPEALEKMSKAMLSIAKPDAASRVADLLENTGEYLSRLEGSV